MGRFVNRNIFVNLLFFPFEYCILKVHLITISESNHIRADTISLLANTSTHTSYNLRLCAFPPSNVLHSILDSVLPDSLSINFISGLQHVHAQPGLHTSPSHQPFLHLLAILHNRTRPLSVDQNDIIIVRPRSLPPLYYRYNFYVY